jgi:hypothetical protein
MITQKRMNLVTAALAGASAVAAACSSSSSSSPPAETNNPPVDASAELGDGPISQLNPPTMTTTPTATSVQCGGMTCNPPSSVAFPLSACCLPDNGCGASFGAGATMFGGGGGGDAGSICLDTSPGTPDTACPSQTAMGFSLPGCCTTGGMCGIDLSMAGLGCNSLSALAALVPPGTPGAGGDAGDAGAPQACSAATAPAPDGGTGDGG